MKHEFENSWLGITGEELSLDWGTSGFYDWSHVFWSYDSDNTLVNFENWKRNKPYGLKENNCVIMDLKAEVEMSWNNIMCNDTDTFVICEAGDTLEGGQGETPCEHPPVVGIPLGDHGNDSP